MVPDQFSGVILEVAPERLLVRMSLSSLADLRGSQTSLLLSASELLILLVCVAS